MAQTEFLTIDPVKRIKKQIRNICDSYSHPWDILAELSQNSIDAIYDWEEEHSDLDKEHKIDIEIDKQRKSIKFRDTGIGFDVDEAPILLAPNSTDKDTNELTVGEKGVGLTFCIFQSNKFTLDTKSTSGKYKGTIELPRNWKNNHNYDLEDIPKIEDSKNKESFRPEETHTEIILEDIVFSDELEGENIFTLSTERLSYLLRTKTAIGATKTRKEKDTNIDINLKIIENDGSETSREIQYGYYYPHLFWDDDDVVDLLNFQSREDAIKLKSKEKKEILTNKCWKIEDSFVQNGKEIYYYGFFVQSKEDWEKIAKRNGLYKEKDEDGEVKELDIGSGFYTATKGMPTGIDIRFPSNVGESGYWGNIFLLYEYDGFKFDIGRKYIPGSTQKMLRKYAKENFKTFNFWKKFIRDKDENDSSPDPRPPQISRMDRKDRFYELSRLPDLNLFDEGFLKTPDGQEAAVAGIFHELIGRGKLSCYRCMKTGYKQDYDFWGKYVIDVDKIGENMQKHLDCDEIDDNIVIEFKFDGSNIISDVENRRKYFKDIDLLVCWKINRESFEELGISVEPIKEENVFYYGSNLQIVWPSEYELGEEFSTKPVLVLQKFTDDIKTG